jgi:hypothetical protein
VARGLRTAVLLICGDYLLTAIRGTGRASAREISITDALERATKHRGAGAHDADVDF